MEAFQRSLIKPQKPRGNRRYRVRNRVRNRKSISAEKMIDKKKYQSKNHKKGYGKKAKIKIDRTVECEIDKSKLPTDAKL